MDQFEHNTPVQGDTQGETSHNEPEQAPIQEAPVQETSARETSAQKNGQKSPMTMFLRSIALRKLNIGRLPTDMLKTVMHRVDMHRVDMHRMCKRKMRNSHLTHISREPICSTAQCTVTTAMFPTAPMRQIRDSRVMHRRSSSMRSMPSRADMWLIPHRAGEFLPCRIYLRKR